MTNSPFLPSSFKNHLLIAMPSVLDPNFFKAVAYIYEHDDDGALGIVINKPMKITLGDVFKHLNISTNEPQLAKNPIVLGGPVAQEQGFIIHESHSFESPPLAEDRGIAVSTSKSVLQAIANGEGPEKILVSLGYSDWTAGQLEEEIAENSWLVAPADSKILFDTPLEDRWRAAAALIGVDFNRLSHDIGHS